ncbi:hypothetical protein Tco_0209291 [Tanacetum coccineum]
MLAQVENEYVHGNVMTSYGDAAEIYINSALLTRDPLPEVKDAYTTVSREESYRGIPESSSVTESKINATSFADKGANQHLTVSTIGMFNVVDISNLKITMGHPNGNLATISHVGNLKLTNTVILYDVLVVPGFCDLKKEITIETGSGSEVCHKAKQTRDHFPLSDHKSEKLGELIYLDFWGPYRVIHREGFKYFLIVDDFSKAV